MPNGIDLILADHRTRRRAVRRRSTRPATPPSSARSSTRSPPTTTPSTPPSTRSPVTCSATRRLIERWALAHSAVKKQIDHLKTQEGPPLVEAFETLRLLVQDHVADEEKNLLPALARQRPPTSSSTSSAPASSKPSNAAADRLT